MKSLICGLALSLVMPVLAAAQAPEDISAEFLRAREDSALSRNGDTSATARAFTEFEQLTKAHPEQPLFRAYYGSVYCIKAREAWFPFTKLAHVDSGLDQIGKALRQLGPEHDQQRFAGVPVSLETRLVAVGSYAGVPSTFNRGQEARQIMADIFASPGFAGAPAGFKASSYLQAARLAQKDGAAAQATAHLRKAVEAAPDSPAGKQAREMLDKPRA